MGEPNPPNHDVADDAPIMSAPRLSLGQQLVVMGGDIAEVFERVTRHSGLTLVQHNTLSLLAGSAADAQEPWQLAQVLAIGSNHITVVLDRLESQGFVTRGPHPHDGRRRLVRLTPAGRECAERTAALLSDLERRLLDAALERDEQAQLEALTARLRHAMREVIIPVTGGRPGP